MLSLSKNNRHRIAVEKWTIDIASLWKLTIVEVYGGTLEWEGWTKWGPSGLPHHPPPPPSPRTWESLPSCRQTLPPQKGCFQANRSQSTWQGQFGKKRHPPSGLLQSSNIDVAPGGKVDHYGRVQVTLPKLVYESYFLQNCWMAYSFSVLLCSCLKKSWERKEQPEICWCLNRQIFEGFSDF